MQFQRLDRGYIVRLHSGEPVIKTLTAFLRGEGVSFAAVNAVGAVEWAQLAYWNAETQAYEYKTFEEQAEVVSFQGNCAEKDGGPFLHIHCVLGRQDYSVVGGHLKEACAHPTLEVWLHTTTVVVKREHDDATGLDLLQLDETTPAAAQKTKGIS